MPYVIRNRRNGCYNTIDYCGTCADIARAFVYFHAHHANRNRMPWEELLTVDLDAEGQPTNPRPYVARQN